MDQETNRPSEVIYQIYPSSFRDSNGKGVGTLNGITEKLDYIQQLNVDAIWINPIFPSPRGTAGDGGYAVQNYHEIDERYGTMTDFKRLVKEAHGRELRVYMDFVPCHTSSNHKWFEASRNPHHPDHAKYRDFYVWHPGIETDHGKVPPNNWKSVFGGGWKSAWEFDPIRGEYYLHHFNVTQPALNLNLDPKLGTSKVQDAIIEEMKFWLDQDVDGFRIDAIPFANYDPKFTDNPTRMGRDSSWWQGQDLVNSMCRDETVEFVARIRKMMENYGGRKRTALGEVVAGPYGGDGSIEHATKYLNRDTGLDSCYTQSFVDFWYTYPPADRLRKMIQRSLAASPDGGLGDALDNHDFPRFATRMTEGVPLAYHPTIIRQLLSLWASLPGSKFMYNGDELGLTQASASDIPPEKILDPDKSQPREYCRTPMPWDATQKNAGFSDSNDPFLPVPEKHLPSAVNLQEQQPDSVLNVTRRLLKQRHESKALRVGKTHLMNARYDNDPIVAFMREVEDEAVLCAFNMSDRKISLKISDYHLPPDTLKKLHIAPDEVITLQPYSCAHYGLEIVPGGKREVGMRPATAVIPDGTRRVPRSGKPGAKTLFALDMLLSDIHTTEQEVGHALNEISRRDPNVIRGEKSMIDERAHNALETERVRHQTAMEMTAGGSTVCTLSTLKKLLKGDVNIDLMGWAANDPAGQKVKSFLLEEAGINLLTEEWPDQVPPQTAVSHVIKHAKESNTLLTYPGTEVQAFNRAMGNQATADLLEASIQSSDIIFLPESCMSKFGLPLTQNILKARWQYKKELVLALPTHASFGPTDSEFFKYVIPSANVVLGNDVEFARIFGENIRQPALDASADEISQYRQTMSGIASEIQKLFQQGSTILANAEMPHGQVAFITCGPYSALLVTKNGVTEVPVPQDVQVHNILGAGNAASAGFLAGYIRGLPHERSAQLGIEMATAKVQQEGPEPYITNPTLPVEFRVNNTPGTVRHM